LFVQCNGKTLHKEQIIRSILGSLPVMRQRVMPSKLKRIKLRAVKVVSRQTERVNDFETSWFRV
jgi:hypothetical protein